MMSNDRGDYAALRLTAFYKETEGLVQIIPVQTDVTEIAFTEKDYGSDRIVCQACVRKFIGSN